MKQSIHLIMPMGGAGIRFFNSGYKIPKPLIVIHGKPFFYWAVQSILSFIPIKSLTFVVLQAHIDSFAIDTEIKKYYPYANICVLPEILKGAVLTCMQGVKKLPDGESLIFNDCDHLFKSSNFNQACLNNGLKDTVGALLTFNSKEPKYSYLRLDSSGTVCGTVEKQAVSDKAICGAYYFKDKGVFLENTKKYLERCDYSEYFISGVYNILIANNLKVSYFDVDFHLPFGTPEEYITAKTSFLFDEV